MNFWKLCWKNSLATPQGTKYVTCKDKLFNSINLKMISKLKEVLVWSGDKKVRENRKSHFKKTKGVSLVEKKWMREDRRCKALKFLEQPVASASSCSLAWTSKFFRYEIQSSLFFKENNCVHTLLDGACTDKIFTDKIFTDKICCVSTDMESSMEFREYSPGLVGPLFLWSGVTMLQIFESRIYCYAPKSTWSFLKDSARTVYPLKLIILWF